MSEERLFVLRLVQEGKVSAAEGAELIRALDGGEALPMAQSEWRIPDYERGRREPGWLGGLVESIMEHLPGDWTGGAPRQFVEEVAGEFGPGPVSLDLNTQNGRVDVATWAGPGFSLELGKKVWAQDEQEARTRAGQLVDVSSDKGRLSVRVRDGVRHAAIHIKLRVPVRPGYALTAVTTNGAIRLEGLDCATAAARSANGRIELAGVSAEELTADTVNGSVSITGGRHGRAGARSVNGSVVVATESRSGELNLGTTNGSIKCRVPRGARCSVEADTVMGSIRVEVPDMDGKVEGSFGSRRYQGRNGAAGTDPELRIHARATNGSISISESQGE